MKRTRADREQDRADLLAALEDAEERPMPANHLVAAAQGHTVYTISDDAMNRAWHHAATDLRALARTGKLVMVPPFVATYTKVDLPGGALTDVREARGDQDDARRQMAGWEPAD